MTEDEHRERVDAIRRDIRESRAELRATLDRRIERRTQERNSIGLTRFDVILYAGCLIGVALALILASLGVK